MKLKHYKIPVTWTESAYAYVDAENLDEAFAKVEHLDFPTPTDKEILIGSFKIDRSGHIFVT